VRSKPPKLSSFLDEAETDVLASMTLPPTHRAKLHSTNPLERLMRFNGQANEEAGDHFTPREVIRLMTHLVYTGEEDVYKPGVYREIYDPACGTGGMLSVCEETIRSGNARANLALFGQEYNDESWAICCSDMLIKDEETDHIVLGDTLGDGKTSDGFPGRQFRKHQILRRWQNPSAAITVSTENAKAKGLKNRIFSPGPACDPPRSL
jgi:hypothetical protein